MTEKNGQTQAPQPRLEEVQVVQSAPIDIHLNSCNFGVADTPDGGKTIMFRHQSDVLQFTASLPPAAVSELVKQLTSGIEIARAMPVMQ